MGVSPGLAPFRGKSAAQGLTPGVHLQGPSALVPACLFVCPELTQLGDPLEPGGLDATGCQVPAGPLIVQKSWGLFQRKLQSISGEWNLKGPNPPFSPQTSNLVFVSGFENKYQKNPSLLCFSPSPPCSSLPCALLFPGLLSLLRVSSGSPACLARPHRCGCAGGQCESQAHPSSPGG